MLLSIRECAAHRARWRFQCVCKLALWATLLVLAAACKAVGTPESRAVIDTLESGIVLVRNAIGRWDERSTWRLTGEVRIGNRDGGGPDVFGDVADIDLDRQGRVYVLDRQAAEIRVFDSNGFFVHTMGGPGRGPGEFRGVTGIVLDRDGRVWAADQHNLRYNVFDSSGALVNELRRPFAGIVWAEWESVITPGGDLYEVIGYRTPTGTKFGLARYDTLAMEFVDTTRTPGYPEGTQFGWGKRTLTARGWWVGVADRYRLWQVTRDGDTLRVVERKYSPVELSAAERDSTAQYHRQLEQRARGYSDPGIPGYQRIFQGMVVDDKDHLWVLLSPEADARGTTLDIFDPEGLYLGAVLAPYRVDSHPPPVIRGDRIAFVTKDELDVAYVVLLRIQGRH